MAHLKSKQLTFIQGSDETPISCMHHVTAVAALPAFSPLHAEAIIGAIEVGPETEVERGDEEDPI